LVNMLSYINKKVLYLHNGEDSGDNTKVHTGVWYF